MLTDSALAESAREHFPSWVTTTPVWVAIATFTALAFGLAWLGSKLATRRVLAHKGVHWTELARQRMSSWAFLRLAHFGLYPTVVSVLFVMDGPLRPISAWRTIPLTLLLISLATVAATAQFDDPARGVGQAPLSPAQRRVDRWSHLFIHGSQFLLLLALFLAVPLEFGLGVALVVGFGIFASVQDSRGVISECLRFIGWVEVAPPPLVSMVDDVAREAQVDPPQTFVLNASWANAWVYPLGNRLIVTRGMLNGLSALQTRAILEHEIAHLAEPRSARWIRAASHASPCLGVLCYPLLFTYGLLAPAALLLALALLTRYTKAWAYRREIGADTYATSSKTGPEHFGRGLEKLLLINATPLVLGSGQRVHPESYDRIVESGAALGYPRPEPPKHVSAAWVFIPVTGLLALGLLNFREHSADLVLGREGSAPQPLVALALYGGDAWSLNHLGWSWIYFDSLPQPLGLDASDSVRSRQQRQAAGLDLLSFAAEISGQSWYWIEAGSAAIDIGQDEPARELLTADFERDWDYRMGWGALAHGVELTRLGLMDEARDALRVVEDSDSDFSSDAEELTSLAILMAGVGRVEEAREHLRAADALNAADGEPRRTDEDLELILARLDLTEVPGAKVIEAALGSPARR